MAQSSALDQKLEHWQHNLLDMTFRNRLLNFRPGSAVRIALPDAAKLFELLVRDERMLTVREMAEEESALPPDQLERGFDEIVPAFDPQGLAEVLKKMRLRSRAHLQEQGVNILHLAFGILRWHETPSSKEELLSPLVLVPVEIIREGPLKPFRVRIIDEDVVANPNLGFKLSTELGITLPEWPEEAVPLDDYLAKAREALSAMQRWRIDEGAYLGLFSFAKLSMYRELVDRRDRIAAHPFINALAGDQSMLPAVPEHPSAGSLDTAVRPADTFQVLDADSSQQEAIEMAKRGISFVLQGPPGTGKSQTIANIIAESLAVNRKVLFVSEKMAALEVVKKRLDDKGLGDHILEIHSSKASKVTVMDELRRSMMPLPVEPVPLDDLQRLEKVRSELDGYVEALHRPRGKMERSAFYVHGHIAALADRPDLPVQVPDAMAVGIADLDDRLKLVRRIESMRASVESMEQHPWKDLHTSSWKPGDEVALQSSLQGLRSTLSRLSASCSELADRSGLDRPVDHRSAAALVSLMRQASSTPYPEASWTTVGRPEKILSDITALREMYSRRAYDRKWLAENYDGGIFDLDISGMSARFDTKYRSPLRLLNSGYRREIGSLRRLHKAPGKLGYASASADLMKLAAMVEQDRRISAAEAPLNADAGARFKREATDWDELTGSLKWTSRFLSGVGRPLPPKMIGLLSDRSAGSPGLAPLVERAETELGEARTSLDWLERAFAIGPAGTAGTLPFESIDKLAADHLSEMRSIREWIDVSALDRACRDSGMAEVIDLGRKRSLPPSDISGAYQKRFYRAWLDQARSEDRLLREFRGEEHADAVALFRRLDEKQLEIAQRRLRNLLNMRREQALAPSAAYSGELGVLRHEAAKKKRFKQIRQLLQECPNIIQALKPCLLMSPLSVSQYLDPEATSFDLVIFDEASQVRPEDAIGSIMRARQVIVVGDDKQLPPTSFFRSEAGDEDQAEDLESILDECSALNITHQMLLWHYRSRHESLIAFSNSRIYDGRLYTFPSPGREEGEWGVSYVRVPDGVYDRSGTRTNPAEARKVAELVFEHFGKTPERSLGVVAFSEAQQMAILDQLEAMRKDRPEFERFFAEGDMQEFFVKNLENVQGDERDVMIFSVGYGKDQQGKMYQNFGPLNKAGGERRLNVAITRARMHVKLVASIGAEDIEGSASTGAKLLSDYLAYAASGGSREILQAAQERRYAAEMDTPLEDDVYRALTAEGLKLQRRIGCSGYRIDLAVEDPGRPGSFLLGIECDGASYRSGKTARDRERTRNSVLRGLGWNLHRIWSQEWTADRQREIEKIKKALAALQERPSGGSAAPVGSETLGGAEKRDKETFRPALLELVKNRGPVHIDVARDVLDDHVYRPEDVDKAISEHLYMLTQEGTLKVKDDFIWPATMTVPPVRRPEGREPMELDYVSIEEIGEAELYNMGGNAEISRSALIERTTAFYRHDTPSERVRSRLELALDRIIEAGRLISYGKGMLRRAR